jgi:hypothetical protein
VPSSPVDLLLVAYKALDDDEQDALFARLNELRLRKLAAADGETARNIASLRKIAERVGTNELSVDDYREAYKRLKAEGDDEVIELNKLIRFFGRWSKAKESLALSDTNTARKIEARFRARIAGRPRQFREDEMRKALHDCAAELGRLPLSEEYKKWRQKEIDLASVRGEEAWLPSYASYHRRFGAWEKALVHYGFDRDEVYARLERDATEVSKVDRYTDKTLEEALRRAVDELGEIPMADKFDKWRTGVLAATGAQPESIPSSSPYRRAFGNWRNALLHFGHSEKEIEAQLGATRRRPKPRRVSKARAEAA